MLRGLRLASAHWPLSSVAALAQPHACTRVPTATATAALALSFARRTQRSGAPPPPKGLVRVGHRVDPAETAGYRDEGSLHQPEDYDQPGADPAQTPHDETTAAAAAAHEEAGPPERLVELTEEEAGRLDRLFGRKVAQVEYVTAREREQLVSMIFREFYRELGSGDADEAMRYQASLEVTWLEEWVGDLMSGTAEPTVGVAVPTTVDEARRLLKRAVLERVDLHKPLSYIIGAQPFFGCTIACRAPLLCPRPETEMWTHWYVRECLGRATREVSPIRVLDMCAGTGCIGIAIAKHVPRADVTAVDLLPDAVRACEENARRNDIAADRYRALLSDMFSAFAEGGGGPSAQAPQANAYPRMPTSKSETDESMRGRDAPEPTTTAATDAAATGGEAAKGAAVASSQGACCGDGGEREGEQEKPDPASPVGAHSQSRFRSVVNMPTRGKTVIAPAYVASFDVLVANPPYVLPEQYVALPRNITHWESKMALVGDDYRETRQYLYFQELCECGTRLLKPRRLRDAGLRHVPNVVIEVGVQARMVASLMERSGLFDDVEIHLDYAGQERWITANTSH